MIHQNDKWMIFSFVHWYGIIWGSKIPGKGNFKGATNFEAVETVSVNSDSGMTIEKENLSIDITCSSARLPHVRIKRNLRLCMNVCRNRKIDKVDFNSRL